MKYLEPVVMSMCDHLSNSKIIINVKVYHCGNFVSMIVIIMCAIGFCIMRLPYITQDQLCRIWEFPCGFYLLANATIYNLEFNHLLIPYF